MHQAMIVGINLSIKEHNQKQMTAPILFVPLAKIATVTDGPRHGSAPAVCPLIRSQLCMSMGRAGEAVMGRAGEVLVISDAR